ncbi:patatin-like phospholipase family protein [Rhodobaculum claviforme]|uniref:Patatin n=1 Tax=Rhodobaculum claviforme TaxID=1549854 RepID=A0A934TEP9_9RHOB|nr:patatin-like phospholipase family protein [Rhodobaculum claviforme]MBK5925969.1 patatin [Rhodobaculum claviforme]
MNASSPQGNGGGTGPRRINLALQGGGAHGAFTWGVLDRLLMDDGIEIAGLSGASAGALNAAALKAGLIAGGRDEARATLDWVWRQVGAVGDLEMARWVGSVMPGLGSLTTWMEQVMPITPAEIAGRMISPYDFGALYRNPLERVVRKLRFDRVCASEGPALFVSATNVRTGKIRVFRGPEVTPEAIMASACLPSVFQAVEIDDPLTGRREAFWDGGFTGNPALFPLFDAGLPSDIVIVNINPLYRDAVPTTPQDIQSRMNEISFNASLLRELRGIAFVQELIAEGRIPGDALKPVHVHMIADDATMRPLSVRTKTAPTPLLLHQLREAGHAAADRFLTDHRAALGVSGTVDLVATCD